MLAPAVLLMVATTPAVLRAQGHTAPESFTANAHATGEKSGAATAVIRVEVQRYTPDADRTAVETALKSGGYPAFLTALRKAPQVGSVVVNDEKTPIRWARERKTAKGRTLAFVTDKPVFFVGGGRVDAKPREGYEVAVIELQVDDIGLGTGSMAAAARVRPGGETGVQIDDYADKPIKLMTVTRQIK
jgi:hypothetical protein